MSPVAPAQSRQVIVVPDLHGRSDLLLAALRHFPEAYFLSLGDAIDRGPRSLECAEIWLDLWRAGRATLLMGNHERMALEGPRHFQRYRSTGNPEDYRAALEGFKWWMSNGGRSLTAETVVTLEKFPPTLLDYLEALERLVYVAADGSIHQTPPSSGPSVMVVHASPPKAHPHYPTPESAALWLRPFDGPFELPSGVSYSLHGHTPVRLPSQLGQQVYLDLGAYETGRLALFSLEASTIERPGRVTVLLGAGRPESAARLRSFGEPLPVDLLPA